MMVRIDPPSAEAMRGRPVYGIMVLGGLIEVVGARHGQLHHRVARRVEPSAVLGELLR